MFSGMGLSHASALPTIPTAKRLRRPLYVLEKHVHVEEPTSGQSGLSGQSGQSGQLHVAVLGVFHKLSAALRHLEPSQPVAMSRHMAYDMRAADVLELTMQTETHRTVIATWTCTGERSADGAGVLGVWVRHYTGSACRRTQ
jgi:hypothetical protein